MATAASVSEDHIDLYICQVCLENQTTRNPRLLSCHHSFCENCLKQLEKEGKIICPTCREVTLMPNEDVSSLSSNFMLLQMKEQMEKMMAKKPLLCHVCGVKIADKKCRECANLLCDPCILKHQDYEGFKEHLILQVCPSHVEGVINHVCLKCVVGVCSICLLNYHTSHKEDIMNYQEGINKLKENMKELRHQAQGKLNYAIERKEMHNAEVEKSGQIEDEMDSLYKSYVDKSEEILKHVNKLKNYRKELQIFDRWNGDMEKHIGELNKCLTEHDATILKLYPDLVKNINTDLQEEFSLSSADDAYKDAVDFLQRHLEKSPGAVNASGNIMVADVKTQAVANRSAKLVFQTENMEELYIQQPRRIQCLEPTKIACFDPPHSTYGLINIETIAEPKIIRRRNKMVIDDMFCNNDKLFVLSNSRILEFAFTEEEDCSDALQPNLKHMRKIFRGAGSKMIIYDEVLLRLYDYNKDKNQAKKVLSDVTLDHVALRQNRTGCISYVITKTLNNTLTFYSQQWNFQKTINGSDVGIKYPSECISTPMGLLVANTGMNCVTLLDHQGELVEACVVGLEDGIRRPISIDYMEPYLWVAECDIYEGHSCIKCFQLDYK